LPPAFLIQDFTSAYALSSGDYAGILGRWLEFFPSEQFHVRYFEEAVSQPATYLQRVLEFLGVGAALPNEDLFRPMNSGSRISIPDWARSFLEHLFWRRQQAIETFLDAKFGLAPSWEPPRSGHHDPVWLEDTDSGWRITLRDGIFHGERLMDSMDVQSPFLQDLRSQIAQLEESRCRQLSARDLEEQRLQSVLDVLSDELQTATVRHLESIRGFNVIQWKRLFFGIRQAVGAVDVTADEEELHRAYRPDDLVIAHSRAEVVRRIHAIEDAKEKSGCT
jgi:hypothetical protein